MKWFPIIDFQTLKMTERTPADSKQMSVIIECMPLFLTSSILNSLCKVDNEISNI